MQKKDVKINGVYTVKVARNLTRVRITQVNSHSGWDGINTTTGKNVRIKSARRLLAPVDSHPEPPEPTEDDSIEAKPCPAMFRPSWPDANKVNIQSSVFSPQSSAEDGCEACGVRDEKNNTQSPNPKPQAQSLKPNKSLSLINAAAIVLEACDRPLSCKEIIAKAIDAGIWQPKTGKTPVNTLYASLLREIKNKADDSRFEKAERGKFILKQG